VAGVAAALLLTGCAASSPKAELQSKSNDVVSAANAGDAAALRTAVGRMQEEIAKQNDAGDLTTTKARSLQAVLTRILANADQLEATESPAPSPSPEQPSPEPSRSPSPVESPSPQPSPSPSPAESPPAVVPSLLSPQPSPS
jgi:hypothetical protein